MGQITVAFSSETRVTTVEWRQYATVLKERLSAQDSIIKYPLPNENKTFSDERKLRGIYTSWPTLK